MTPATTEPTRPESTHVHRGLSWAGLFAVVALSITGGLAVQLGHRFAPSAVIDLGPTDGHYVRDFRDVEREGRDHFRWSTVPSSSISLPMRFCGPGELRLRVRRHFVDPATLVVSVSGSVLGQRIVLARDDHPYEILQFRIPEVACGSNVSVLLETSVDNDRPLGVAVDWIEVRGPGAFRPSGASLVRGALLVAATSLAFLLAGSGIPLSIGATGALIGLVGFGFAGEPVAAERILRGGLVALVMALTLAAAIARMSGLLRLPARCRTALLLATVLTLVSRSAFLHPGAFYPDYRVHGLVQQTLNRSGLSAFLDHLFEIQYARSLGLQQIDGNWYPFPYPPGAYVIAGVLGRVFGLDSLDAATVTAIAFASLIPVLTLALGLSLGLSPPVGLAGAFYVAIHPLLLRRMALGYFPGLAGQFADALALLLLLGLLRRTGSPIAATVWLTGALLAAFLVYTQSIANFGLLIAGLLVVETVRQSERGRKGVLCVAAAGVLALLASAGAFYWRYLPVFENVENRRVQPESRVLDRLEQAREMVQSGAEIPEGDDLNDPYSGSTLNPLRGVARLGSRLWRFNGLFVLLLALGGWLLVRQSDRPVQNVILAWSGVAVWISLLAAGLPSPNGFQHLKDLEFVTPLAALAMGVGTARLWARRPAAAIGLGAAWLAFVGMSFRVEWTERLLKLSGL